MKSLQPLSEEFLYRSPEEIYIKLQLLANSEVKVFHCSCALLLTIQAYRYQEASDERQD